MAGIAAKVKNVLHKGSHDDTTNGTTGTHAGTGATGTGPLGQGAGATHGAGTGATTNIGGAAAQSHLTSGAHGTHGFQQTEQQRAERGAAEGAAAGAAAATGKQAVGNAHVSRDGHIDTNVGTVGGSTPAVGHGQASAREGHPVCSQTFHTKVEDRPVVKEVVTTTREHHPIEKQFVTEVRPTGQEREIREGQHTEVIGSKDRVVDVVKGDPCAGTPTGTGGVSGHRH